VPISINADVTNLEMTIFFLDRLDSLIPIIQQVVKKEVTGYYLEISSKLSAYLKGYEYSYKKEEGKGDDIGYTIRQLRATREVSNALKFGYSGDNTKFEILFAVKSKEFVIWNKTDPIYRKLGQDQLKDFTMSYLTAGKTTARWRQYTCVFQKYKGGEITTPEGYMRLIELSPCVFNVNEKFLYLKIKLRRTLREYLEEWVGAFPR